MLLVWVGVANDEVVVRSWCADEGYQRANFTCLEQDGLTSVETNAVRKVGIEVGLRSSMSP